MNGVRDGLARSVQVRLVQHAKAIGSDANLVMTRFAIERFLYRLSRSQYAERFVLKGALLMLAWLGDTLRPTRDADLLGFGELSDETLARIFTEVCNIDVEPDALIFMADSVRVEPIRAEDAYGGQRVTLDATMGAARLRVQVDIGIGDVVVPPPEWLDYPRLLDDLPQLRMRAYSPLTVIAEKIHAVVFLGFRNSRMKDFFDLHALAHVGGHDTVQLSHAIAATFARRQTLIPANVPTGLSESFALDAAKLIQWNAFLKKNRLEAPSLEIVIEEIWRFIEQPLAMARKVNSAK